MSIINDQVVAIHYTVKANGEQLDSSEGKAPLEVLLGHGQLVPGLEAALLGKAVGDKFAANITAEEAYGERSDNLVQAVPKDMFGDLDVEPGMQFRATTDDGDQSVMVIAIEGDEVIIDGNHPLAGVGLDFDVEVISVREASEDELAHGHIHSSGGCCGGKGHDDEEHECCGGKGHDDEEHECCGGKGHDDEEHECCGGKGHDKGDQDCCGGH